jgi:hypothetical protein
MDYTRFDSLTRMISSRRAVSGALVGTLFGLLGFTQSREAAAAPCPKGKQRCGKKCIPKRGCCKTADCRPKGSGQVCQKNRCICLAGMKRCGKRCLLKAAACPPKPDASCQPGGSPVLVPSNTRVVQTFIEPNGGQLVAAAFRFRNQTAAALGTYQFRVQPVDPATGLPQPTILGVVERSAETISNTTLSWVRFDLPVPPRLLPGRKYALVLSLLNVAGIWQTERRTSTDCPGGELFSGPIPGQLTLVLDTAVPYQTFVKA